MAAELGLDAARMHREGAHPLIAEALVETHREQDVRGLRAAVGNPGLIRRAFEPGIVEIDVTEAMAPRAQRDDPSGRTRDEGRSEEIRQQKMPEMVRAE